MMNITRGLNKTRGCVAVLMALSLAGCGGGGGDEHSTSIGDGSSSGNGQPTYVITENNASEAAGAALNSMAVSTGSMLVFASTDAPTTSSGVRLQELILKEMLPRLKARRVGGTNDGAMLTPQAALREEEPCAAGGKEITVYSDQDGNEDTSQPGDYVEVQYESCKPFSNVVYNGKIRMTVKSIRTLTATRVAGVMDIEADLSIKLDNEAVGLKGVMAWDLDYTQQGWEDDNILTGQFIVTSDNVSISQGADSIVYSKYRYRMDTEDGFVNWQFDLTERVALNGRTFDVATEQRFAVRDDGCPLPHAGVAAITGAGSRMRVTMRADKTTLLEIDENGDGRFDKTKVVPTAEIFDRSC